MRRLAAGLFALSLALGPTPAARSGQTRPVQSDAVVRLLADLESALTNNRPDRIRTLAAASLPAGDLQPIEKAFARGPIKGATVRERGRRPVVAGFEVLADVLVSRGQTGRIATWQLTVTSKVDAPDRYEIIAFSEIAALDGLLQIALDPQKTYSVHNLTLQAPDLTLKMASGTAFVAEESGGVTALVLLGKGDATILPRRTPAEQRQLRIFPGVRRSTFRTDVDAVVRAPQPRRKSAERVSACTAWSRRRLPPPMAAAQPAASSTDYAPRRPTTSISATSPTSTGRSSPPSAASSSNSGRGVSRGSPTRHRQASPRTSRCSIARTATACRSTPRPSGWRRAAASTAKTTGGRMTWSDTRSI